MNENIDIADEIKVRIDSVRIRRIEHLCSFNVHIESTGSIGDGRADKESSSQEQVTEEDNLRSVQI